MTTQLGLDYSDARPDPATMRAAGVVAVGRYLGTDSRCITSTEYQTLTQHGISVWLVKESQTSNLSVSMLNGYNKGLADALAAEAAIKQVGLPAGSPVYWAADFDIAPGSARVAQAEGYVDGWNTIIPAGRRGGYGGLWFLNYLHGRSKVDFLWECASTSFRHGISPGNVPLHIQQTTDTPPIPGTDYNNIFDTTSFAGNGGIPLEALMALKDTLEIFTAPNRGYFIGGAGFAYDVGDKDGVNGQDKLNILAKIGVPTTTLLTAEYDQLRIVLRGSDLVSETAAAVPPTVSPAVDVGALAKALAAALPQGQSATAAQIAAELVKHIS